MTKFCHLVKGSASRCFIPNIQI